MRREIRKVGGFLKRDFRMLATYRVALFTTLTSVAIPFLYLILFGSMFGIRDLPALAPYGGDFVPYIMVGIVGWGILWSWVTTTAMSLRNEMYMGTLESIFLTPTKPFTLIFSYMSFGFFLGALPLLIIVFGISVIWGIPLGNITIYTFVLLLFSVILMMGLGLMVCGLTMWAKNIGNAIPLTQSVLTLFCGVFFPITVLPAPLQGVAKFIPFYYSIEGLRKSLIPTTPVSEMLGYIGIVFVLSIAFILVGAFILKRGIAKAKKDGTLVHY